MRIRKMAERIRNENAITGGELSGIEGEIVKWGG
jgi:hypothetical protein